MSAAAEVADFDDPVEARVPGDERAIRAALLRVASPGGEAARIAAERGPAAAWAWIGEQAVAGGHVLPDPGAELAAGTDAGARLVVPGDGEWPYGLADLTGTGPMGSGTGGAPFGLWVRGPVRLDETCTRSVAVVGARASSEYGNWVAAELAAGLVERGVTVVSGAAFGIDASAHRGTLAVDGTTVAVLAGGIDVPYPRAHARLLDRIASTGLVVSEAPPGRAPRREAFLVRNRLIAALSRGVVLVEAGLRSGARNTAAHAAALGRPRMAMPGPVTSASSAGCHALLRADPEARLVTNAAEVVEEIGRLGEDLAPVHAGPADPRDGIGRAERAVLDVMPTRRTVTPGWLAAELNIAVSEVVALTARLADRDLLAVRPGGYQLTARARAPTRR